jgi:hypothetical protein
MPSAKKSLSEGTNLHGSTGLKSAPELVLPPRLAARVVAQFALRVCKYWAWSNRCDPFEAKNGRNWR